MGVLIFINDMNAKYEKYINYIVNELEPPYFKNMEEMYGLKRDEFELVLTKLYNQPLFVNYPLIYDKQERLLYSESNYGAWEMSEYDHRGNKIYFADYYGAWGKREFDDNGNEIYFEDSYGYWEKREYDENGQQVYYEDSTGVVVDNR